MNWYERGRQAAAYVRLKKVAKILSECALVLWHLGRLAVEGWTL